MPQFMAKCNFKTQYHKTKKVNYCEEDEIINSPHSCTTLECNPYHTDKDGEIYLSRRKPDTGTQYRHEKKDDVKGFIPKPVARPEYDTVYQHQGMLLQNLHRWYLYIVIRLPHLADLDQRIPEFPDCDNYGIHWASNPKLQHDDIKINDNALHQQLCTRFKADYLEEMDIIHQVKARLEKKINETLPALLPNKIIQTLKGLVTATGTNAQLHFGSRKKRALPVMAILQAGAAIGGALIKGINALVDTKELHHLTTQLKWLQQM